MSFHKHRVRCAGKIIEFLCGYCDDCKSHFSMGFPDVHYSGQKVYCDDCAWKRGLLSKKENLSMQAEVPAFFGHYAIGADTMNDNEVKITVRFTEFPLLKGKAKTRGPWKAPGRFATPEGLIERGMEALLPRKEHRLFNFLTNETYGLNRLTAEFSSAELAVGACIPLSHVMKALDRLKKHRLLEIDFIHVPAVRDATCRN